MTTTKKQNKPDGTSRSTVKAMRDQLWRSPAGKRQRRAAQKVFRQFLKKVDRWEKDPRYLGVTFPGIKDGIAWQRSWFNLLETWSRGADEEWRERQIAEGLAA